MIKINLRCRLKILKQKLEDNIIDIKEKKKLYFEILLKILKILKILKRKKLYFEILLCF